MSVQSVEGQLENPEKYHSAFELGPSRGDACSRTEQKVYLPCH